MHLLKKAALCLTLSLICFTIPNLALYAEEKEYKIEADSIEYDPDFKAYTARGNIHIRNELFLLKADELSYFPEKKLITAHGNISLEADKDRIESDFILYKLDKEEGHMENARLFIPESGFNIKGGLIKKLGKQRYTLKDVTLSSCDLDNADWEIRASELNLSLENYGSLKHGNFRIKGVPTLYAPWLFFPVKSKRQSGLLLPEINLSDRYGYQHLQPLYLTLGDSADTTLYYQFMEKNRDRVGLEFRKVWSNESKLRLLLDGLKDKDIEESKNSEERYWLRMKQNLDFSEKTKAFLDLDILSDKAYLSDFKSGSLGFDKSDKIFKDEFGRNLDPDSESLRTNKFLLTHSFDNYRVEGEFNWEDDTEARRLKRKDENVQSLPRVFLSSRRQKIDKAPLYHSFEGEAAYFYRIDGNRGKRIDLAPRIYSPFYLGPVSVEPSLGLRQTIWFNDNEGGDDSNADRDKDFRFLYDAGLDFFTESFRVFDGSLLKADKIRHGVQPRISLEYISDKNQEDLPFFDSLDRIEKSRKITYSLTQNLTARYQGEDEEKDYSYRELMRLKFYQSYDLEEAKSKDTDKKAFSDAKFELSLFPLKNLRLFGETGWSPYLSRWNSYAYGADIRGKTNQLYIENRYSYKISNYLKVIGYIEVKEGLGLLVNLERNLKDSFFQKQDLGIRYSSDCWQLDLIYSDDKDEKKIGFYWTLNGLGGFEHSLGEDFLP